MSFGFRTINASGSTTISDQTYNPVYVGNAALQTYYIYNTNGGPIYNNPGNLQTPPGNVTFALTGIAIYNITLPAGTNTPLPFIKSDGNVANGCSIAWTINTSGTTWQIGVWICGGTPTIMVFASPQNITPTGNGMLIRRADGSIAFNSNYKHLIPNSTFNTITPTCSLSGVSNNYFCAYYASHSEPIPNLPANPAFLYSSPITDSVLRYVFGSDRYYCYYTGIGRISGGNFITTLGCTNQFFRNYPSYSVPRDSVPIVMIDASKYY